MFLPSNITLQFGDSGDFVLELQRRLILVNAMADGSASGFYDGTTVNAVTHFQATNGLRSDGIAGPETLRRLNGVIAGDTSGNTDNKQEEEAKAAEAQRALTALMMEPEPQPIHVAAPETESPAPASEEVYTRPVTPPAPDAQDQWQEQQRQQYREQALRDQHMQAAPPPPSGNDLLAQMLLQTATPAVAAAPEPTRHERPPLQASHAANEPPAPGTFSHAAPRAEPAHAAPAAEPEQPKGLLNRARQFADAMVQKLHSYFEAKLPPSVLSEVQSIGQAMAKSGMRENPIPSGPEMPTRAQELPTRGPDQTQQRG